jgi:type I restriction enzyme S subunit
MKLTDLGSVARGKSKYRPRNDPSLYGGNYPFLQTGDVKDAALYLSQYSQTYNEKGLAQSKLWDPGTLCITIAANIAETAVLKIKACFPDSIVGFVADPAKADVRFIKYLFDTMKLRMQSISRGTTQDNLSVDKLLSFDFLVPSVDTQHTIADILSAYDGIIENNAQRIQILGAMARLLYEEWFVKFRFPDHPKITMVKSDSGPIPKGWNVGKLGDKIQIRKGKNITQATVMSGRVPVVAGGLEPAYFHNAPNTRAPVITISASGANAGFTKLYFENVWASDCSFIDRTVTEHVFFYYLLLIHKREEVLGLQRGSAQPHVYPKDLMNLAITFPPVNLIDRCETTVAPLFDLIGLLKRINSNFVETRDLLLPKLISGEIDITNLDIKVLAENGATAAAL